ncbi:MAG: T9SS type A sorting domain-containing protein [Bacteroidota bacterium]
MNIKRSTIRSLTILWLIIGYFSNGFAQSISNYQLTTNSTASLNRTKGSLVDDIDMNVGTTILIGGSQVNVFGPTAPSIPFIGFDFYINGIRHTQFNVTSNGWVTIGGTVTPATTFNSGAGIRMSPFLTGATVMGTSSIGRVHSKVVGAQPNRVLVVEFLRMAINSSVVNDTNTFQVRLYENDGSIEFVYGRMEVGAGAPISYNVGFQFTSGTFQHVNTTTNLSSTSVSTANVAASTGPIAGLSNRNPGSQFAYLWTPNQISDPQPVSITNITTTGMTVNWANVANEVGYALYRSTDGGVTYSFVTSGLPGGLFAANTTSFNATGLIASTTYDWRVYAIRESVSQPADGTATTSAATRFFTTSSGLWSDPAIWNTLAVPSGADTAEISTGHTVELDAASISSGTLIVNGTLNYWNSTTQQTLTVNGDLIINTGAALSAGIGSGPPALTGPHILNVGGNASTSIFSGNVIVDGSLNLQTTASVQLRLNGTSNSTVSGNGATCAIPFIQVNKGGSPVNIDNTVEFLRIFTQPNTASIYANTQRFQVLSGTLKLSAAIVTNSIHNNTVQLFNTTLGFNSRLWLNHTGINIGMIPTATNQGTLNISNGELLITNGTLTLGTGGNNHSIVQNVRIKLDGGNLNLFGSLNVTSIATAELEVNGGLLSIDPQATQNVNNFTTLLNIGASSRFVFTGGEIQIVDPHSAAVFNATFNSINIPTGGIKSVTGGKFVIGNGATAPSGGTVSTLSGFSLNIQIPIHRLELRNDTTINPSRYCRLAADLTINDSLILGTNSYLRTASALGFNLNVNGAVLNNGRISGVLPQSTTPTALGAINFTGTSSQTVTGTGSATVLVTRVANSSGVTFNNTGTWAHERFTLELGNVTNAINSIAIGGFNYRGNIVIGGLNETTASGSFSTLPTIITTGGLPNYSYGPSSTALTMGSANEMASGSLNANTLTINDAQGVTSNRNINVQILNLTLGNLNVANNNLTIGTSAANPGSLTRSSGFVQLGNSGQFTRWFAIGASPAFEYTTGFPLATSSSERSVLWSLNGGTLTGGGNLTVRHNNIIGITDLSPSFSDGGITINRRTNAFWSISSSTAGSFNVGTSNLSLRIIGAGTGAVTNATELQLIKQNGVAGGTAVVSAGTNARPELNRDFSQANITGGALFDDFYIGANSAINPLSPTIIAIQTGNWNDPATWEGNVVPTVSNFATIASGVTVTIPASVTAACNGLNIQAGATLNANSGTLNSANAILLDGTLNAAGTSVNVLAPALNGLNIGASGILNLSGGTFNIGTTGGGNNTMAVSGGLNISGGALTINGNVTLTSTSSFSQSGGDFNIDPNSGTSTTSVAQGTHSLLIQTSNVTCTNGTITIIDPPHNSIALSTTNSLRIAVSTGSLSAFSGTHTIRLGNGTSTETGNTNGFSINTRASSGIVPLQNVRVSGGNATGRWTSSSYTGTQGTYIKGNLTIDVGSEFRHTSAAPCAIGGNIINNGTLTVSTGTVGSFILGTDGNYPLSNAQDISGTGIFRNNLITSTGAFTHLFVNNGVGLTLSTTNTVFTVTGTFRIDALRITTNTNTIGLGASSTFTRTSGYIVGNLAKNFTIGSNISRVFEIGNATNFLPVNVTMNQVTTAGSISVGLNTGDHPTLSTSCINPTKSINNFWKVTNLGVVTTASGGTYVFNFLTSDVDPSTNLNNAKLFSYSGTDWLAGLNPTSTSSTSFTVNNLNNFGDIAIGEINPIPTSVTINATSTDICVGSSVTFTANVTNGGAAPTYQWKLNGTNIGGATASTYVTTTLNNQDTITCDIVSNNPCVVVTNATSNKIGIKVSPLTVGGLVSSAATICSGSTSGVLTLSGHTGDVVRWESSTSPTFTTITSIANTNTTYTSGPLTTTTYFRAVVKSGACAEANSASVLITVDPTSVGGTVSANQAICAGGTIAALTISGNTGNVTTWQSSTDAGFTSPTNIAGTAGLTSFTPTGVTSTTFYRAVVQSGVCPTANSSSATITVTPASVGGTVSSNQTICSGGTVTALTLTGNTGTVTTWQSSADVGFTTPTNISGTAGLSSFTPTGLTSTTFYRAVVQSGSCATANSNSATITVTPTSVGGSVSSNQTICLGGTISALTLSGNVGTVTTWQSSADAGFTTPTNISGTAGLSSFTPTGVTSTTFYRAVVQSGSCATANSSSATITVTPASVGGSVSSNQTICLGGTISALTLSGNVGTVVTWQSSANAGFTTPTNISGTAGLSSFTPTGVTSTTFYRAVVQSGSCATANSSSATITVTPASVGGSVSSNQTICSGGTVTALTLTGNTGTVTTWQSSADAGFTTPTNISGTAGLSSFTPTGVTSTTFYRAVVQSGSCTTANSSSASITVNNSSVGGTVSSDQTICSLGSVAALTLSGNIGSVVTWQSASDLAFTSPTNISGTAGLTSFTPTGVATTTYYRAVVQNGSCASANSSAALITVSPASIGGTVSSNQTICSGTSPSQLTLTGNVGNVTTWQSSSDAGFTSPTNISGTAGQTTFTPGTLTTTTYFRAVIQSGGCSPANSVAALITVTPGSVGGSVSGTSAVCSGQSATLTLSGSTGSVVNWESAIAPFVTYTTIANTTTTLNTGALSQTTRFRAVVQSGSCPTATSSFQEVTVTSGGVWTGTTSNNWGDASNWCGGVPTSSTNVVIPTGTPNAPIINVAATANNLTIDAGASVSFTGTNSITLSGNLIVNGTFTTTGGTVIFNGTATQNVAGVTYNNLTLSGSGNKTLTGNATLNGTLNLSGGLLVLSNSNLTIGSGASITGGTASNYIQTSGSGALIINNLGATPRTYPVGVGGTYNPVTIANSGTADNISVRLLDQVYATYAGEVGTGVIAGNVVNRTFIINEAVAGGSNLNITFQWNASNELTMSRAQTIVGRYNGGVWSNISGAPSAALGSGPFTFGISTTNTGIFGVGDVNSPLPVRLISFDASLKRGITKLTWTTASEINNSHFVVERGIDGYNFEAIGQVKGRGNSSVRVDYAFDDLKVNDIISTNGVVYYRLKQVGFSGNTEYSGIVSVAEFNNVMFELVNAVPNPFNDQTAISFKTSSVANVKVEITDAFGKLVQVYNVQPTEGANKLDIQLNDQSFAAGVYFVRLQQNEQSQVIRIVKR